ncbi:polysaccharide pyruvyl transferase family protein [Nitrosomonas sp. Nm33]|uniref:polysaccharide pyruvyl transferase family protein n=1 Tax=Nitrosomonas sp. Nm33 TaxID=133724 RepID=UPI00089953C3|nr:polysaccharide pyruvyl transferase family protein [Nitrosomonas sp. Nm33]SDY70803.1 Polysaccharide pyruvyl transferase family protein WcaK [Nitrosomonas sp. Nm33]
MTTNRIGILFNNNGTFGSPWRSGSDKLMNNSGHNIGNFAFWRAADILIDQPKVKIEYGAKPAFFKGKIDRLVIPASSFLREGSNFGWLADFIEELDLPCAILGIGAPSDDTKYIPKLSDGTKRFLNSVSKRTPFLGVRGEFTKLVCKNYGVNNTEVMGCPSILLNPSRDLGKQIEARWHKNPTRIAVHAAYIKEKARNIERRLFELLLLQPGSAYIIQRPVEMIKAVFGEVLEDAEQEYLAKSAAFLDPDATLEQYIEKLRRFSYIPHSIDSWIAYLMHFSHALGTRIHGTILSLNSGIPAICVHHDARTKELCDSLHVPTMGTEEMNTSRNSLRQIFEYVRIRGDEFDENRIRLARRNRELLSELGIQTSIHLNQLAE